jgi:prepilin-type N-terminal cleavage/methylation domain-containing protein
MEPTPTVLKTKGFSLIELLIAVSLVAGVMSIAFMILDSARRVAEEISGPSGSPVEPFWTQLQSEIDRILPSPVQLDTPPLRFSKNEGVELVSLLPDPQGIPLETHLHYYVADEQLLRVSTRGFPLVAETNIVAVAISEFRAQALIEDQVFDEWPKENEHPLPPRITLEIETDTRERRTRDFYLPASFRIESADGLAEPDET